MDARTVSPSVPPVWSTIATHGVFPEAKHDEIARYNFLANLNKYLSTVVAPGNRIAYEKRVRPRFRAEHGRDFQNRDEVRKAMKQDPYYQMWSALRRTTMEMRQQNGRSITIRQAPELAEKAAKLNEGKETLVLNPSVKVPHYLTVMDNHCMPGSYHTELFEGDVSAAANYDTGLFVTTAGGLGRLSDGGGKAIAQWVLSQYPEFKPKRILDIGCGLGHNTLPLAQAFPDAEVIGIDVGAPMLRYGHARAQSLGVRNVKFIQADAAQTGFPDESFDWIQTTMFLHETSFLAIHRIMQEIYRMLKRNGLTLHIEQPQYTPDMDLFEQTMRDWDAFYNNEPFWGVMHDLDPAALMEQSGFDRKEFFQIGVRAVNDLEDFTKPRQQPEAEDYGRAAVWNVFGAWKR
ncbi:MAG: class I SAM-dependent methyltransferase [Bacteroidota bacterium]|nr:class I SAM-dependent methyltransferase [Candidatus Kapabacteria bacterium]MDW8219204.1 class I SAM-dependent methyltransferase [Bacteroidota bacterium]